MCSRFADALFRRAPAVCLLATMMALLPLLGACDLGGQRVVITATPAQGGPAVVYITATFTPAGPVQGLASPLAAVSTPIVPATLAATADLQATLEAALAATMAAIPTETQVPPTETPIPPTPDLDATVRAAVALTQAAAPTNTPVPPTKTPTKKPPSPTRTPTPGSYPPPELLEPSQDRNCYNIGGCTYTWTWSRTLADNQYFQVQLIGPGGEHRGIHPPTKGFSFKTDASTYWIITDWCNPSQYCWIKWTVAVVEWDGVDPSKIGRTLTEAAPRQVIL